MAHGTVNEASVALRTRRVFLGVGAGLYLSWWGVVELMLPGAFNPLPGRMLVVAFMASALAATFTSAWAASHAGALLTASLCAVTTHYAYLIYGNHGDPTWWAGCVLVVAGASVMPVSRRALVAYSAYTLAVCLALVLADRRVLGSIFLPSIATILLLCNVAQRSRLRADAEHEAAVIARVAQDRAEEANKLKGMFLGLVSHELVTPLQSITLNAQSMERKCEGMTPDERARTLARIRRGARRLTDLIESLLEYTRVEAGRLEIRIESLDLCVLAHEVVDELVPQAHAKGLEMRLKVTPDAQPVRSDRRLVRLILTNLAANAVRYTESGSIEIAVSADAAGHRVTVADTGPGIAPEVQGSIFEAFTQLEPLHRKHHPGVGLGLALVKHLTAALGASVEVSSAVGAGTTFTVVFPDRVVA